MNPQLLPAAPPALLAFALLFALLAWLLFLVRDIRVSGEGAWRLPGSPPAGKKPKPPDLTIKEQQ